MANRRQGYGGGRSYYNSGPVNPWQVGNAPGNQGNHFNNANQSNLLSQLSEPQAQLALALSKLLQPQQQVPSLLTMNTVNPLQNTGYGQNNYSQRGRSLMSNRRSRSDMKPFNKMNNRNSRDADYNRRRGNSNKKPQPHQRTTVLPKPKKPSSTTKASSKSPGKTAEVKVKTIKEEKDEAAPVADTTETSVKQTDEKSEEVDTSDKKREWKEEKNDNDEEDKEKEIKEEIEEVEDEEKDNAEKLDESGSQEGGDKSGKYEGIPKEFLHCLICQKKMWDGESFEKHLNGRAHMQMFEKVEESYRIKADMMREAIRLSEEKNNIEMDRMKRLGKKTKTQQLSRCAMCDLEFYGQLFIHRKSPSHQKLKHFLHPRCSYCNKEFPTRMEWENHRHTAEHLRKKAENLDKKVKPGSVGTDDEGFMLEEECFIVIDSIESDEQDDTNVLIDFTDEDFEVNVDQIPLYKPNRAVGMSLITPSTGFYCKPCARFFLTENASQLHAQSKQHYDAFIGILKEKIAETEKKRKAVAGEDDEGNWKRRKTMQDGDEKVVEETVEEAKKNENENGEDYYDPADSFTTVDPNDICLSTSKEEETCVISDEVWNEVDNKIDDIIEQTNIKVDPVVEKAPEPVPEPKPVVTPTPTAAPTPPKPRPQRAVRGRRN